ncbi:hypothetical protein RvY_05280-2 [Ramazzottius varieornatus]|nr:hypothetical protein RvY_05280-2 [Ramazzottius varieornatus]
MKSGEGLQELPIFHVFLRNLPVPLNSIELPRRRVCPNSISSFDAVGEGWLIVVTFSWYQSIHCRRDCVFGIEIVSFDVQNVHEVSNFLATESKGYHLHGGGSFSIKVSSSYEHNSESYMDHLSSADSFRAQHSLIFS